MHEKRVSNYVVYSLLLAVRTGVIYRVFGFSASNSYATARRSFEHCSEGGGGLTISLRPQAIGRCPITGHTSQLIPGQDLSVQGGFFFSFARLNREYKSNLGKLHAHGELRTIWTLRANFFFPQRCLWSLFFAGKTPIESTQTLLSTLLIFASRRVSDKCCPYFASPKGPGNRLPDDDDDGELYILCSSRVTSSPNYVIRLRNAPTATFNVVEYTYVKMVSNEVDFFPSEFLMVIASLFFPSLRNHGIFLANGSGYFSSGIVGEFKGWPGAVETTSNNALSLSSRGGFANSKLWLKLTSLECK